MSESGHSESGPAAGAGGPPPAPPVPPTPPGAWLGRVLVAFAGFTLFAAVAAGLWIATMGIPDSIRRLGRVDGGQIFVHGPQVYTRERLVNDRYQEDSWLNSMLDRSPNERFGYSRARGSIGAERISSGVTVGASDSQPGSRTPGTAADGQGLPDISEQPTFKLQATRAYREQIRTMLIENQLDDRHDLHGNTLYRLRFDATILPTERSESAAQIEITIEPEGLSPVRGMAAAEAQKQSEDREQVLSGKASYDQFQTWLARWEDLYSRWRGSLEQRFEDEAIARAKSYESGRFGPDDYDALLGRLRGGVLQLARQIDEVPKRLVERRKQLDSLAGAAKAVPGESAGDRLSDCIAGAYREAAQELDKLRKRSDFPVLNQPDTVEQNTSALKDFREAFLLGVMESGDFIEKHPFHEIYRDRIRKLLILRRDLLRLTDTSRCDNLLGDVSLMTQASSAPVQGAAAPAGGAATLAPGLALAPPAPGAPPPAAATASTPLVPVPAPPPPGAMPPPAGPPVASAPPGSPAMPPAVAAAPAPPPPAAVQPGPASPPGGAAAGTLPLSPGPGPGASAQQQVQFASVVGPAATTAEALSFIDATQLQRRLLDSEFWARIYKAATGVDDSMGNIDDLLTGAGGNVAGASASGVGANVIQVTPPSLKLLAVVTWEPQRKYRVFQVGDLILPVTAAIQRECLSGLGYGSIEPFTIKIGDKTQTFFVPQQVVTHLKATAPALRMEIVLQRASVAVADAGRQRELLTSRKVPINPCDFDVVRVDVPVGLFNFAVRLSEAREIYTYSISPTEPDELIANRMRADMMREFGMQAAMKNMAQAGIDGAARLKAEEEMSKFMRFDTVQRSVFGYGEKAARAKVGWYVLPRDQPPAGEGSDKAYLAPRQIPMTALVSLPAWWDKIRLTVNRAWIDRAGRKTPLGEPGAPLSYVIDLPTNFETLDATLLRNADTTGPVLVDWQIPRMAVRPCQPFAVTLLGRRLWRSTVVTLAGERANKVLVMPNMQGIIATFEKAPRPGNLPDKEQRDNTGKPLHYYAQLTVWTSQGGVNLPRLIKFELPSEQAANDPACIKAADTTVRSPPTAEATGKPAPPADTPVRPTPPAAVKN